MTVPIPERPLKYIDLFAGCGGLSLGLEKAGPNFRGFELVFAVEKSDMAAETFFHNFIKRLNSDEEWRNYLTFSVQEQARRGLIVRELKAILDEQELTRRIASDGIDLVAGGPPCQSFSMAGRRDPTDPRNELPWQFLEFVEIVRPKAVIIENVVGINQDFDKRGQPAPFTQLGMKLEDTGPGYIVQRLRLNAQDFGVPQHRPRMVLLGVRRDIAAAHGITATDKLWRSDLPSSFPPSLAPHPRQAPPRTVDDALWDIEQDCYVTGRCSDRYRMSTGEYAHAMRFDRRWSPPAALAANELVPDAPFNQRRARHSEKTMRRFELYRKLDFIGIPSRVLGTRREDAEFARVAADVRSNVALHASNAPFPWLMPTGEVLAKSAEDVVDLIVELHTRKHSQRALRADKPAPTVLTLPDDFVHYREPRIHTVRELARFQSFPDSFVFRAKESTGSHRRRIEVPQYTQVGNAVPPMLAKAIGDRLYAILSQVEAPRD